MPWESNENTMRIILESYEYHLRIIYESYMDHMRIYENLMSCMYEEHEYNFRIAWELPYETYIWDGYENYLRLFKKHKDLIKIKKCI